LDLQQLLGGHLELRADGGYQNSASVWYFGEGPNSVKDNKTDFRREFTAAHFTALTKFFDQRLTLGYTVGGLLVNVGPGDLDGTPSTETVFTEANTPGLVHQTNFITGTTKILLDLTHPGFSNPKGVELEANDSQFFDQGNTRADFHLLETQFTYY